MRIAIRYNVLDDLRNLARGILEMARLNVYLPDDVFELARKWRGTVNLSEICARALRDELRATEDSRSAYTISDVLRPPSTLENELADQYQLKEVLVCNIDTKTDLRNALGKLAANYLDRTLCDDALLAIAGGRQMWCMVRNLSPRRVRVSISALGVQQNDPRILHAHANTLVTLLWLLYGPRSEAHLIGTPIFSELWGHGLAPSNHPRYFIFASCGPFNAGSPFADLIGPDATLKLIDCGARGDFAYQFFDEEGKIIAPLPITDHCSIISSDLLRALAKRTDARVVLVAGGQDKIATISIALRSGLCNVLITDRDSATSLSSLQ